MKDKKALFNASVIASLYIAGAGILYSLLQYVLGILPVGMFKPFLIGGLGLVISLVILVILLKKYRKTQGGFISFGDAFLFGLIALVLAAVISSVYSYLFMKFFDPEYMKNILEAQKDWMENYFSSKGMSEEQIQAYLDKADQQANLPILKQTLKSFLISSVFSAVIALIVGAIMKKNRDVFNDQKTGGVI
ncbi:MAG TPA: DUF4199 domain-containing protein [Bacteroidales bacterium]|nr:DUF4199 domain-containing protein [Bacteroidales bacterium]HPT03300.1 DUF4199 domain-containing protein [Bacteroidales bacterium]